MCTKYFLDAWSPELLGSCAIACSRTECSCSCITVQCSPSYLLYSFFYFVRDTKPLDFCSFLIASTSSWALSSTSYPLGSVARKDRSVTKCSSAKLWLLNYRLANGSQRKEHLVKRVCLVVYSLECILTSSNGLSIAFECAKLGSKKTQWHHHPLRVQYFCFWHTSASL